MEYWIVCRGSQYVQNIDKDGNVIHTSNKSKAYRFYDFGAAMSYFNSGYCVIKEYN